jgi:formate hydrogenlyase subunit 6/NADH:ubiquinone oxidoreductase subunit I
MDNGRPVWQHQCDQCFGCYACCPRQAIHTGKKDNAKLRDHHPELDPGIFEGIPA